MGNCPTLTIRIERPWKDEDVKREKVENRSKESEIKRRKKIRKASLLVLGADGTTKAMAVEKIAKNQMETVAPTLGFHRVSLTKGKYCYDFNTIAEGAPRKTLHNCLDGLFSLKNPFGPNMFHQEYHQLSPKWMGYLKYVRGISFTQRMECYRDKMDKLVEMLGSPYYDPFGEERYNFLLDLFNVFPDMNDNEYGNCAERLFAQKTEQAEMEAKLAIMKAQAKAKKKNIEIKMKANKAKMKAKMKRRKARMEAKLKWKEARLKAQMRGEDLTSVDSKIFDETEDESEPGKESDSEEEMDWKVWLEDNGKKKKQKNKKRKKQRNQFSEEEEEQSEEDYQEWEARNMNACLPKLCPAGFTNSCHGFVYVLEVNDPLKLRHSYEEFQNIFRRPTNAVAGKPVLLLCNVYKEFRYIRKEWIKKHFIAPENKVKVKYVSVHKIKFKDKHKEEKLKLAFRWLKEKVKKKWKKVDSKVDYYGMQLRREADVRHNKAIIRRMKRQDRVLEEIGRCETPVGSATIPRRLLYINPEEVCMDAWDEVWDWQEQKKMENISLDGIAPQLQQIMKGFEMTGSDQVALQQSLLVALNSATRKPAWPLSPPRKSLAELYEEEGCSPTLLKKIKRIMGKRNRAVSPALSVSSKPRERNISSRTKKKAKPPTSSDSSVSSNAHAPPNPRKETALPIFSDSSLSSKECVSPRLMKEADSSSMRFSDSSQGFSTSDIGLPTVSSTKCM